MKLLRLLAIMLLLAAAGVARADTPITLWKSFDGRVNFAGTQVTIRAQANSNGKGNNKSCSVYTPDTIRQASLSVPSGATVLSAQLYWAGSGPSDNAITFEGKNVAAERKYSSATVGNYNYFGGAADVTAIVQAKGSGTYSFSGLTVSNGDPWCSAQGVLGGFSLLVVYAHPNQPERVLNLYEGFTYVQNGEVVVEANNFRWNRTAVPVEEKARVGHISWEGDSTLAADGERLLFEGNEMTDAYNPEGNQFNSKSNINNDSASYGIDFDAYDTTVVLWSGYDATVTTKYRTGQDLVLLNAEVLLVPTMAVADLSIAITRPGTLRVGSNAEYTVTVTNNGPYTEAGPITVSSTLPAGMSYVSGSGTNWSCSASGTTGTCTYTGKIVPGTSAPALTVKALVQGSGEKTVSASVKGTNDDNAGNNSASDTGMALNADGSSGAASAGAAAFAFTDSKCNAGVAIGSAGQCNAYSASTVGGRPTTIWITALSNGVPAAISATADTKASLRFALECVNPVAGTVPSTYAGADLPACAAGGQPPAWSGAVDVPFLRNVVSVEKTLVYKDVGQVRLILNENGKLAFTGEFVSAPLKIGYKSIRNGADANPGTTTAAGTGFAAAGAPLTLEIGAQLEGGKDYAPNFGNEKTRPGIALGRSEIDGVALVSQGELVEGGTRSWLKGILTTTASWSEVGAINFTVGLVDPEVPSDAGKSGLYLGVATPGEAVAVGRFYPSYFKTVVAGPFDCPASLPAAYACPRLARGAVYSRQPFQVTVEAYNARNERLQNFTGAWFRPVTLHAAGGAGEALLAVDFVPPAGAAQTIVDKPSGVHDAVVYRLAAAYDNAQPRGTGASNPTNVFVRAVASDANVSGTVVISSLRNGEVSDEGAILVLNGRLKVPNALGTDVLRTPLGLRAEYWAGAAAGWLVNPGLADPLGADAGNGNTKIVSCSADFAGGKPCADVIGASAPQLVKLAKGAGVLWLRAPGKLANGRARGGSASVEFGGWTWLPSTTGRVNFGSHRSPVIYVRELYF
ncbi:DUF6701 domain-containing protein [Massilia litorea]|uniref:DUF11 domain-containing protein n=1 Tax=Massilia litorea TaxID=2769491 RepID=A0A7L9U273_9BURK|nr:DUF6701 domain-containing protein [Massilia litorea]QOL49104.1 DUF11 domain-containing protein [Massilia litorea]